MKSCGCFLVIFTLSGFFTLMHTQAHAASPREPEEIWQELLKLPADERQKRLVAGARAELAERDRAREVEPLHEAGRLAVGVREVARDDVLHRRVERGARALCGHGTILPPPSHHARSPSDLASPSP